jgi:hypothetical protein
MPANMTRNATAALMRQCRKKLWMGAMRALGGALVFMTLGLNFGWIKGEHQRMFIYYKNRLI